MKRFIFPDPLDATCKLQPDSMAVPIVGVPDTHPINHAPCQSFDVPSTVPNKNGATLTIEKPGFAPVVLHGILETITAGGGGFECDVFRLQGCCRFAVTNQHPVTFGSNGGSGSFTINTTAQCKWDADEDAVAEDFVKVASGVIVGTGTKTFTVFSEAQAPQPPLPRSGYIDIFDAGSGGALVTKVLIIQQK
jgi:hypothetical protein